MSIWGRLRYSFVGRGVCSLIPQRIINILFHFPLALLAIIFYRYPARKLKVIGVTGTDGKTTVVNLIYHILKEAGLKTAMISTVSARIGDKEIGTGFHVTAPNPWLLQKLLRTMVNRGVKYVVLEATSHGLDQHRFLGCNFEIGVITNITHEHLDYHKTWEKYLEAKAKLLKGVKVAVLNRDDKSYEKLKIKDEKLKIITYGIKNKQSLFLADARNEADFMARNIEFLPSGSKFSFYFSHVPCSMFHVPLVGEYNVYNCLAAIAATLSLRVPEGKIRKAVASFRGVKGRMEEVDEGQDFKVIIDFAHTPNALEQVLKTLHATRDMTHEKLIVVFGCAGLRDQQKRPIMGKIAAKYADFIVLTAEDPRTEDVNQIIDEIAQGCLAGGVKYVRVPDRQEAINFAIQKLAKKGDIVVICGKGHEKSMCFGRTEYPWSDEKVVRKALKPKL